LLRPGALADAPRNGNRKRADRPRPHDLPAHPPRGHPRRHDLGVIAAVVLAAGAATRYGAPKQRELLPRVLARLAESPVDEVVVVAGAHPLESGRGRVVDCPEWEAGPGASLRCGLRALGPGVEAAVVCLADGPNLAPEAVRRVLTAWRAGEGSIVAASYAGARGHPLV